MDYEKKYKEALEKARQLCAYPTSKPFISDLRDLFPELSESEDERVKKAIITLLNTTVKGKKICSIADTTRSEMLAWLEKQGEQKCTAEEVLIKAGLKPYKDGDQWCILLGDNIQEGICGFGDTIDDALYAFLNDLIKSQKEQKPVKQTLSEEVDSQVWQIANNAGITWEQCFALLYATKNAYERGKADAIKEHKPANWFQELEDKLANATPQQLAEWKEKYFKEEPAEWSEDDETCLTNIIIMLKEGASLHFNKKDITKAVDWLKYWLKSLRPQSHWRPSKRQKEALLWCVVHLGGADKQTLGELLEELNKL